MSEQIKPKPVRRFAFDAESMYETEHGKYVLYSDHAETVQQLQQRNGRLLAALIASQKVCRDAFGFWSNDQDSKVGKILRALSGDLKGYRNDIDSINDIIAEAEKQV